MNASLGSELAGSERSNHWAVLGCVQTSSASKWKCTGFSLKNKKLHLVQIKPRAKVTVPRNLVEKLQNDAMRWSGFQLSRGRGLINQIPIYFFYSWTCTRWEEGREKNYRNGRKSPNLICWKTLFWLFKIIFQQWNVAVECYGAYNEESWFIHKLFFKIISVVFPTVGACML